MDQSSGAFALLRQQELLREAAQRRRADQARAGRTRERKPGIRRLLGR
jgi:hypothetical protein